MSLDPIWLLYGFGGFGILELITGLGSLFKKQRDYQENPVTPGEIELAKVSEKRKIIERLCEHLEEYHYDCDDDCPVPEILKQLGVQVDASGN